MTGEVNQLARPLAAAGAVGSVEAQLAKHRGAKVIGTCGDRNFDYLRQLGIKPVRYGDGIVDRIRQAAGGPVTALIDNFGQDGHSIAAELGLPKGRHRSSADRRHTELRLLRDDPESLAYGSKLLERLAQLAEVLDDPVQGDRDLAPVAAGERVGILLGDTTMRRPARVPEADRRCGAVRLGGRLQLREVPDGAHVIELPIFEERQAGRVISAVLQ